MDQFPQPRVRVAGRCLLSFVAWLVIGCNRSEPSPGDVEVALRPASSNPADPGTTVHKGPLAIEACLIWGTDTNTPPDSRYGPVQSDLMGQLKNLPLRWTNYFLVNKARFLPPLTFGQIRALSDGCQVELRAVGGDEFEVTVFHQGKNPVRRRQSFSSGQVLVVGGKGRAGSTCWLVLLRRVQ